MAEALIRGLIAAAGVPGEQITASDPTRERLEQLSRLHGVGAATDNVALVECSDIVVLAVKPQVSGAVLAEVRGHLRPGALVISIAAGVTTATIEGALGSEVRVVRTMPNTPALVGIGATAIAPGANATAADVQTAREIFDAVGMSLVTSEDQLDAVTGLSGSGPAYFFLMIEALAAAGAAEGLSEADAQALAVQTMRGAAELLVSTNEPPAELRRKVTSPGGTTMAGLSVLDAGDLRGLIAAAVAAATARSRELGGPPRA